MIRIALKQIKQTLTGNGVDFQKIIDDFGQVQAYEDRLDGKEFGISEHIKGLIYAQLSNQRPWGQIAKNLKKIDSIFSYYDKDVLKADNPKKLVNQLLAIKCGNRKISDQMLHLKSNIKLFEEISEEFGNIDAFICSKEPEHIAKIISSKGKFKFKQIGFTLAMEYLKNVGINAIKPDLHICRIIGPERLGFTPNKPTPREAYKCLMILEKQSKYAPIYIDNLLWIFAAKDYGNICTANPKCSSCKVVVCRMNPLRNS